MFEKDAEEYVNEHSEYDETFDMVFVNCETKKAFQDGAEFGYNKANEWHYVKDELPKESGKYLVYVGGVNGVFVLDFETEYNDFGYWCLQFGENLGVSDTVFETITERNEDKVIAWKEIVLPKEIE